MRRHPRTLFGAAIVVLCAVLLLGLFAVDARELDFAFQGDGLIELPQRVLRRIADVLPAPSPGDPPRPLRHPPSFVKGIYATNWSAGNRARSDSLIALIQRTELNAIVIDIKDFSGVVGYETGLEKVKEYGAEERRIKDIDALLGKFHAEGIYVIGRLAVFQDQALARARPDLALKDARTGSVWRDAQGLAWLDTASREVWEYNAAIARDALRHGFDEINFDYVRFASDGDTDGIQYPAWDRVRPMRDIVRGFFAYLRDSLGAARLSADLFGLVAVKEDDLGIGQYFEDAFPYFDYISPMIYPSHYSRGLFGFSNPAAHPYEVVSETVTYALRRMERAAAATTSKAAAVRAKLRPWFQDFDLGVPYTPELVRAQFRAFSDAASTSPERVAGWLIWNPSNVYREAVFREE